MGGRVVGSVAVAAGLMVGLASGVGASAGSAVYPWLPETGSAAIDDPLIGAGSIAQRPGAYSLDKLLPDGVNLHVAMTDLTITKAPPLDGSPFSGEFYLDGDFSSEITGPENSYIKAAVFETGYLVGYPFLVYPDGFSMNIRTPELSVTGGVSVTPSIDFTATGNGGLTAALTSPGANIGFTVGPTVGLSATAQTSATAKIPSQEFPVAFAHGGTTEVPISQIQQTGDQAFGVYRGVFITVTGVVGPITVKPYVKLAVSTEPGDGLITAYGSTVTA